jgi:hypothetical protein
VADQLFAVIVYLIDAVRRLRRKRRNALVAEPVTLVKKMRKCVEDAHPSRSVAI